MHDVVDLRSDTLTTPTPAMRTAMAQAEVGDARRLAEGLAGLPGLGVDPARVQTNIVILRVDRPGGATHLVDRCRARKVRVHAIGSSAVRCVTHRDVDAEDVERAIDAIREITAGW